MGANQQKLPSGTVVIGTHTLLKRDKIGKGAYGHIYLCSDAQSGGNYALKQSNLKQPRAQQMYNKEITLLRKMNELKFKGSVKMIMSEVQTVARQKIGRILMQFGPITLFDEINNYDYKDKEIYAILLDVCKALAQLHSIGVTHLDLKPENIVLVGKTYKLCDFGSALIEPVNYDTLEEQDQEEFRQYLLYNTTLMYSAPQMVEPSGELIGPAVDMWQLGCVAYIMTFGQAPFKADKAAIVGCKVEYPEGKEQLTQIIKQLLQFDPEKRLKAKDLVVILQQKLKDK